MEVLQILVVALRREESTAKYLYNRIVSDIKRVSENRI